MAASLAAVGGWLRDGVKLALLGALGLGLLPLLIGGFMELAMVPLRCRRCRRHCFCCCCVDHALQQGPAGAAVPLRRITA